MRLPIGVIVDRIVSELPKDGSWLDESELRRRVGITAICVWTSVVMYALQSGRVKRIGASIARTT